MASQGNQHCACCIGTLSFRIVNLGRVGAVVSASDCSVGGPMFESHVGWLCLSRWLLYMQPWARAVHYCSA